MLGRPPLKRWYCVFCDIVDGLAPADIVQEWDDAIAIVPLNPVAIGHLLVIPKRHVETFFSAPEVSAATMRRAAEVVHGAERYDGRAHDYNIIASAGRAATQTVLHLHVHLVPRRKGDGLALPWTGDARPSEMARLQEGWTAADEAFDHFLDDIALALTDGNWEGDLTPESVLAYVGAARDGR